MPWAQFSSPTSTLTLLHIISDTNIVTTIHSKRRKPQSQTRTTLNRKTNPKSWARVLVNRVFWAYSNGRLKLAHILLVLMYNSPRPSLGSFSTSRVHMGVNSSGCMYVCTVCAQILYTHAAYILVYTMYLYMSRSPGASNNHLYTGHIPTYSIIFPRLLS